MGKIIGKAARLVAALCIGTVVEFLVVVSAFRVLIAPSLFHGQAAETACNVASLLFLAAVAAFVGWCIIAAYVVPRTTGE